MRDSLPRSGTQCFSPTDNFQRSTGHWQILGDRKKKEPLLINFGQVDYWYLKQRLGLGEFRLHNYEAIHKWYTIVYLTLTFWQWRLYQAQARGEPS